MTALPPDDGPGPLGDLFLIASLVVGAIGVAFLHLTPVIPGVG